MKTKLICLAGILAFHTFSADGALIWEENFLYPNGQLTSVSGGLWTAFNGAGSLPIMVSDSAVKLTNVASGVSGEDVSRPFDVGYSSGALYVGAVVSMNSAPTAANGDYFLSFYSSASSGGGFVGRVFASAITEGGWSFGLANGGSNPADWSQGLTVGTSYKIIVRLDLEAKTTTMGVFDLNYTPLSDAELTLAGSGTSNVTAPVDGYAMRQGSGSAFSENIGAIWTGTALNDVSGVTAVPEPGTVALIGLGLAAILFGGRRLKV